MDESGVNSGPGAESPKRVAAFCELNVYLRRTCLATEVQDQLRARNVEPIPNGLHILVSQSTGEVVGPVLLFLANKLVRRLLLNTPNRLKKSFHTRKALADDLKDFYDFLDGNALTRRRRRPSSKHLCREHGVQTVPGHWSALRR